MANNDSEQFNLGNVEESVFTKNRQMEIGCTRASVVPILRSAVQTLIAIGLLYLFICELHWYLQPELFSEIGVRDASLAKSLVAVNVSVKFPKTDCTYLQFGAKDDLGRSDVVMRDKVTKTPLRFGGCLIDALFRVHHVPGEFTFTFPSVHDLPDRPDLTHSIAEMAVGDSCELPASGRIITDQKQSDASRMKFIRNPLADTERTSTNALDAHEYLLTLIHTSYTDQNALECKPYQYTFLYREFINLQDASRVASANDEAKNVRMLPVLRFKFEFSPFSVAFQYRKKPFYHFLTQICAILGGVYTISKLLNDAFCYLVGRLEQKLHGE